MHGVNQGVKIFIVLCCFLSMFFGWAVIELIIWAFGNLKWAG